MTEQEKSVTEQEKGVTQQEKDVTDKSGAWQVDVELEGFEVQRLASGLPGRTATLVRAAGNPSAANRAILYVHGFTDYFFQAHLAEVFLAEGYAFYALDLHGYGRSLGPDDLPNYCRSLNEYYPELDAAIDTIQKAGADELLLMGHSTGGLILSLYCHDGERRQAVDGLILNSPFLDFPVQGPERYLLKLISALGRIWPQLSLRRKLPSVYARSIYSGLDGEWEYNTRFKPAEGFPLYAGWVRAIVQGQRRLQAGLQIACPVLLLHSARSHRTLVWDEDVSQTDIVLNVEHMRRYGPGLGSQVSLVKIEGGLHDLVLSAEPVRQAVFSAVFRWLGQALSANS